VVGPATLRIGAVGVTPDRQQKLICYQGLPSSMKVHSCMTGRSRRCSSFTSQLKQGSLCTPASSVSYLRPPIRS